MIPAARVVAMAERMPGSEWLELVIAVSLTRPERFGDQRHGRLQAWGVTFLSLTQAWDKRSHLERVARNLEPDQVAELYRDPSPEAAELRRLARA